MSKLLAFLLLISFHNSLYAKECKNVLKELLKLYPEQDKKMMALRIENAKNKHKFLRSFIPYYYKRTFELKETLPVYSRLRKHVGQIAGDAHVENFGYMVNNKGKPVLTLNDFDDVAEAPLFLDVMRLSQSSSYMGEFKQADLIKAYKQGLAAKEHKFSNYISKLEGKANKGGVASKADVMTTPHGPRFASNGEPFFETTAGQQKGMESVLKKKYGNDVKIHDSYKTNKESGGSAFGTRYHALVEFDGDMHFIEFNEIMEGGVVNSWITKPVSNEERILKARKSFLGNDFDQRLDVVQVEGTPFQLRFKAEGNKSIDLAKVKEADLPKVIEDEFYILGQLHRKSLGNTNAKVADYLADLEKVKTSEWEESVKIMRKEIKKAFDAGQK